MFELDRADGTKINRIFQASPSEFSASSEQCDVRIGPNRFQGDLHTYEIHVEIDDVVADLTLRGTVPSWRPEMGYFLFGEHSEYHFAWLPSVPQGDVEAAITIAGNRQQVTGVGYHDHNWGNFLMALHTGDIQLDRYEGDKLVESLHEEGIWELLCVRKTINTFGSRHRGVKRLPIAFRPSHPSMDRANEHLSG